MKSSELDERLARYKPYPILLRPFFQGVGGVPQNELFEEVPETSLLDGLDEVLLWSGLVDGLPFRVAARVLRKGGLGFEVSLPVRMRGSRIDVSLLDSVRSLSPALATARTAYIEHLPFRGDGFGVAELGSTDEVFRSSLREDAVVASNFLNSSHHARFAVIPSKATPARWVVQGPYSGPYISRLEVVKSQPEAERLANRWSDEMGARCYVGEGEPTAE